MKMVCYAKCGTCRKAKKWLNDHALEFEERDIKEQNPTAAELKRWQKKSGLAWKKFFNTSGMLYRELELSKKLPDMSEDEQFKLLASDGMLVKRPLLITKDKVITGFKESEWEGLTGK